MTAHCIAILTVIANHIVRWRLCGAALVMFAPAFVVSVASAGDAAVEAGTGTPIAVARGVEPVDRGLAARAGIRVLAGNHLLLYTDLPAAEPVDVLPAVFDAATAQWCRYFGIRRARAATWRVRGCLMRGKEPFRQCGLLPPDLPPFRHGFSRGRELWLNEQPTAYYRRHLLLHEGTHAFMNAMLGGCGPPWYMEGIAELLATHTYGDGKLTLGCFPRRRDDVPMLGRIGLIQRAVAAGHPRSVRSILAYRGPEFLHNEAYAWSWALAALLDGNPSYRKRYRTLPGWVRDPDFTARFRAEFARDWPQLNAQWQLLTGTLEYGYDLTRTAIDFRPGRPLSTGRVHCTVAADRGWQNTGLRLAAGRSYQLAARGRYQVANKPRIWWCEPGGVTIRYCRKRPLGVLLATVWSREWPATEQTAFLRPVVIGTGNTLTPRRSGTLFLAINDSPAELDDNAGSLDVVVVAAK